MTHRVLEHVFDLIEYTCTSYETPCYVKFLIIEKLLVNMDYLEYQKRVYHVKAFKIKIFSTLSTNLLVSMKMLGQI